MNKAQKTKERKPIALRIDKRKVQKGLTLKYLSLEKKTLMKKGR